MIKTHRMAARITAAAGMALAVALAGQADAQVRLDPDHDDSKGFKFLATGDVPFIDFTTLDGEVLTNESLKGKLVVVDVWASWCVPCMAAMPHFKSLVEEYGDYDKIVFLGVSMDNDRATLDKTIIDSGITWKQVFDKDRNLNKAWNQGMLPTIAIIAPTGESVYVGHPMNMDAPFQEALKEYVPEAYSAEKHEAALAKAAEAAKAREVAAVKRRAEAQAQAAAAYKPGDFPLSEIGLTDLDGNLIPAETFSGKVVIMDFWATWCGPCMASMPHMKELYAKHHEADGLEIIGISRDRDLQTLLATKEKIGMPWLHHYDGEAVVSKKFNVTGIPQIFIFSRTGEYLWAGHPANMDEPLEKILADDTLTAKDFVKADNGKPKSIPMVGKTPAMPAAKPMSPQADTDDANAPKAFPAAMIIPMEIDPEVMARVLLEVGAKPEFTLTDLDGTTISSEDLKGKIVVMDFWATWCGPCMAAVPHMIEIQKEHGNQGVQIIGISLDKSIEPLKSTIAQMGMTWPQHHDADRTIAKQFGVKSIPTIFILSPDGEVLWTGSPTQMDGPLKQAIANHPPSVAQAN